jgi:hypothetical protein
MGDGQLSLPYDNVNGNSYKLTEAQGDTSRMPKIKIRLFSIGIVRYSGSVGTSYGTQVGTEY